MTSTETQTLKIILGNKGKASVLKIAKELKISTDYSRLICRDLIKDKFIEFFEGEYKITNLGKRELVKLGLVEKVARPKKAKGAKRPKKKIITRKEAKKEAKETSIAELSGLSPKLIEALKKKGFKTLEDIATTSVSRLMELMEIIEGLELKQAAEMINKARNKLRKKGKEYLWEE